MIFTKKYIKMEDLKYTYSHIKNDEEKLNYFNNALLKLDILNGFTDYLKANPITEPVEILSLADYYEVTIYYSDGLTSTMYLEAQNYSTAYIIANAWAFDDDNLKIDIKKIGQENGYV